MNHAKISCHFNCIRNTGGFVIPFDRLFSQSHIISSAVFLLHNILHTAERNPAHGYRKPLDQPVFLHSGDPCLSAIPKQIRKTVQTQEKQTRSKSLTEKELKVLSTTGLTSKTQIPLYWHHCIGKNRYADYGWHPPVEM